MSKLTVAQVMELAPVIPVLVVDRVEDALPIALALVKGGLPALKALAAPLAEARFCPTGGITVETAP